MYWFAGLRFGVTARLTKPHAYLRNLRGNDGLAWDVICIVETPKAATLSSSNERALQDLGSERLEFASPRLAMSPGAKGISNLNKNIAIIEGSRPLFL